MDDFIGIEAACALIGRCRNWLYREMAAGCFARPTHRDGKRRLWRRDVIEAEARKIIKAINPEPTP